MSKQVLKRAYKAQRGAAMTEFVIAALFFLLPLYLGIQAMGKFTDVRHTAHAAARYASWEKTVWFNETATDFYDKNKPNQKSEAAIQNEIAQRIFNDRHSALNYRKTDQNATSFANGLDPLWQDTAGTAYLKRYDQFSDTGSMSKPAKDLLGGAIQVVNAISIPHVTGGLAPPVPINMLAGSQVRLGAVAAESQVYQRLWSKSKGLPDDWAGLDIESHSGLLSNTWAANASGGTKAMVKESVPTANALGKAVELSAWGVIGAWDPMVAPRLDLGKIGVDVVPPDRLR